MAYDPADLKLPHWLLRSLDLLIAIRIPLGWGWRLGFTRPGIIFAAAWMGLWAAALYSGNNLLYLSGAMLTAIAVAAIVQGRRVLKSFPDPAALLPLLQENSVTVIRKAIALPSLTAAVVAISWHYAGGVVALTGRCEGGRLLLQGRMKASQRGIFRCKRLLLSTSAPLGLLQLSLQRRHSGEMVVMPEPRSWQTTGQDAFSSPGSPRFGGDEWHDLRGYLPGDALAQVHWRKASADMCQWRVKRFVIEREQADGALLRVDLRLPSHASQAAFERMLGKVWFWVLAQRGSASLILGQQHFALPDAMASGVVQRAIAAASVESAPAAGEGGLLLAVDDES